MEQSELVKIIGSNPAEISIFLESLKYDLEKYRQNCHKDDLSGVHFRSPFEVAEEKCAICCEASAAMGYTIEEQYNPKHIALLASKEVSNPGHSILAFQDISSKKWGSLGHSSQDSQKNRLAIYSTLKELVMSYNTRRISYAKAIIKRMSAFPQGWAQRQLSIGDFQDICYNSHTNK